MKSTFVKITVTSMLLFMAILMNVNLAFAQQEKVNQQDEKLIAQVNQLDIQHRQHNDQHNDQGDQRDKMEAQRVAFITQELKLTPDEAKAFWPVYNEYDAKRHDLKKSFRESGDYHKTDIDKLTEKEATQILDNQIIEAQKFLDLRKEYHAKFKSVLPAVKILKLYDAERQFQKMLMDKMHSNNSKPPTDKK